MNRQTVCASVVLLFVTSTARGQVQYTVTDLGTLPGYTASSQANGINSSGQVVGSATAANGDSHAFLYNDGTTTDLGTLATGYGCSWATSINEMGQVVGSSAYYSAGGIGSQQRPTISNGDTMASLGSLGGGYGFAMGINNIGQAVGLSLRSDGCTTVAFLYSNGSMIDLGAFGGQYSCAYSINDATQIVGNSTLSDGRDRSFLWQNGSMTDLGDLQSGSGRTMAYAINSSAQVVGQSTANGSPVCHAYLWQNGTMEDLGVLIGNNSSRALGINDDGIIVGDSFTGWFTSTNAFIWNRTDGMESLNDMLDSSGVGWTLQSARGINNSGQICGYGVNPSGQTHAFLLTPTPEPSTLALFAVGAIALYAYGWRRASVSLLRKLAAQKGKVSEMKRLALVLVLVTTLLVGSSQAVAGTLLFDDFESYSIGTFPPTWVADANAVSDTVNNVVVSDPANPSNKALKLSGVVGATWASIVHPPTTALPAEFVVDVKVYNGSEALSGGHPERACLELVSGTSWAVSYSPFLAVFRGTGQLAAGDFTASNSPGTVLASYDTGQWYDLRMQYTRVGSTRFLHYWLNGTDVGGISMPITDISAELALDNVQLISQEGTAYFDNFTVSSVPEPSTFALLGVGAIGLVGYGLRRRRAAKRTAKAFE